MNVSNKQLGFVQEFYALEIRVGTPSDSHEAVKRELLRLCQQENGHHLNDDLKTNLSQIINRKIKQHFYESALTNLTEEQVTVKIIDYQESHNPLLVAFTLVVNLYTDFSQYATLKQAQDALVKDLGYFLNSLNPTYEAEVNLKLSSPHKPRSLKDNFFKLLSKNNLFWNASGASILLLEESYTDHNKYKNLGAAILLTGAFAFVSAIFALSYLTDNYWILVPVGLLWGLTIVNLDMMIINTMVKYKKQTWKSFFGFLSRVLLAVAIAISISIPIEMTLLEDEIRDKIERYDRNLLAAEIERSMADFSELDSLKAQRVRLREQFNQEMQGQGSGRVGYGTIAKKIEDQLDEVNATIEQLEAEKDSTQVRVRTEMESAQEQNNKYGFLASYRALHRLQYESEDNSVFYIAVGIKCLLLLIELLPIISKSLMRRGAYDALYELEEQKYVRQRDRMREEG